MARKGILLLIFLLCTSLFSKVNNFTVKDLHGTEHDLYSYLDDGKHVLIEFMMFD